MPRYVGEPRKARAVCKFCGARQDENGDMIAAALKARATMEEE
ncbi:MAG TPA: hypothetical protein VLG09_03840 [Candidatus Saccharimonadales bacterium]|nr:hypothetical protein [Candidatus Saccharimonadales bacterium]